MPSQNKESNFIGITKITVGNIGLEKPVIVKIVEKAKGKPTPICRIIGQAVKMKAGETDKGDYVKFTGLFSATNYVDGQEYRSGNLILPNVCSGTLEGLLGSAQANLKEGETGAAVVFGYELLAKGDAQAATGYVFSMKSLVQGEDPLAGILENLPPIPTKQLLPA